MEADLAYWLERICPEEAADEASLAVAARHGAEAIIAEMPAMVETFAKIPNVAGRKSELARWAARRGRQVRNDWLKAHGAYARG